MQIDWPPAFEPIESKAGDCRACARDLALARLSAGEVFDGCLLFAPVPERLELALLLDLEDETRPGLVRFALMNAMTEALAGLLPPMLPITHRIGGALLVDGKTIGKLDCETDDATPRRWLLATYMVELLDVEQASVASLSGQTVDVGALLGGFARHALAWINRYQDDGFEPVRSHWSFRLHDRLEDPSIQLSQTGSLIGGCHDAPHV